MTPELGRTYSATEGYGYMIWIHTECYHPMYETDISGKHKHLWLLSQSDDGEHLLFLPLMNRNYGCSTLPTTLSLSIEIRNSTWRLKSRRDMAGFTFQWLHFPQPKLYLQTFSSWNWCEWYLSCLSKCLHIKILSIINNDCVSVPPLETESISICSLAVLLIRQCLIKCVCQ